MDSAEKPAKPKRPATKAREKSFKRMTIEERDVAQRAIVPRETLAMRNLNPPDTLKFESDMIPDVLERVADGISVVVALREMGFRKTFAFYKELDKHPEYAKLYDRACECRAELWAESIDEFAVKSLEAETPEQAQGYKLIVNTRQWLAARLLPRKYGERVTLQGDAENPLVTHMVASSTDLLKKLRGVG